MILKNKLMFDDIFYQPLPIRLCDHELWCHRFKLLFTDYGIQDGQMSQHKGMSLNYPVPHLFCSVWFCTNVMYLADYEAWINNKLKTVCVMLEATHFIRKHNVHSITTVLSVIHCCIMIVLILFESKLNKSEIVVVRLCFYILFYIGF